MCFVQVVHKKIQLEQICSIIALEVSSQPADFGSLTKWSPNSEVLDSHSPRLKTICIFRDLCLNKPKPFFLKDFLWSFWISTEFMNQLLFIIKLHKTFLSIIVKEEQTHNRTIKTNKTKQHKNCSAQYNSQGCQRSCNDFYLPTVKHMFVTNLTSSKIPL